ncbi:MAG: hypothetical protein KHY88_01980 [Erysipelotrichaceae bacterium]|nr:hypothetical protein [Erysipelotrichaceae bacterium]
MKKSRFEKRAATWLVFVVSFCVLGHLGIQAMESSKNVEQQKLENQIKELESDINGLDIERQNMTTFAHLNEVASSQGYTYSQNEATAYLGAE